MCGIAGILSADTNVINQSLLQKMGNALEHRGPDGEGTWINREHTLGFSHRRLAIIDTSPASAQPMHYLDRYSIVYNGAIYNYKQIRKNLGAAGFQFQTEGDTEVILAAFAHYRELCLDHLDGMFAFAIWDKFTRQLFIARDRFGEKPFYYSLMNGSFYFGSEMKALWCIGIPKIPDLAALGTYLSTGHTQQTADPCNSFFENISALPAGHYAFVTPGDKEIKLHHYFTLPKDAHRNIPEKDAIAILQQLLQKSVTERLNADVEIGSSLSGGLDSSVLAGQIAGIKKESYKTFSATFPGFEKDESAHIKNVTEALHIHNHSVSPTAEEWLSDFEKLCYHQEVPFSNSGIYAQYRVYKLAKENGVKVLLDGQGADEVFAGYTKYLHWFLQQKVRKLKSVSKDVTALQANYDFNWSAKNYVAAFFPGLITTLLEKRAASAMNNIPGLHKDYQHFLEEQGYPSVKADVRRLVDILHFDVTQSVLPEFLRYADRNSMAHGVEVRLPFLQHDLVKFIFSLPASFKIQSGFTKSLLRKSAEPFLSKQIIYRPGKTGFETPQQHWMQEPLLKNALHHAKEILVEEKILDSGILKKTQTPIGLHAPGNYDFRFLCAAELLKK